MENLFEQRESRTATGRRDFLKTLGFGAAGAAAIANGLFGGTANAQTRDKSAQTANLITKKIPRTGEVVPAIGLGSFLTFDGLPGQPREFIREVIKRFTMVAGATSIPRRFMARAKSALAILLMRSASPTIYLSRIKSGQPANS